MLYLISKLKTKDENGKEFFDKFPKRLRIIMHAGILKDAIKI